MRANRNLDSRMLIAVVKVGLDKMVLLLRQRIRCKPTNLRKLENYQSGPLDVDPMDRVRGLKHKKRPTGGGLKHKKNPTSHPSIGLESSGPDW